MYNKFKSVCENVYNAKSSKLKLYAQIKTKLCVEPYIALPDADARICIAQLRLSCDDLPIERGCYLNLPVKERLLLKLTCKRAPVHVFKL